MALPSFARRMLSRGHGSQDDYEYCASVDFLDAHSCLCTVVEDSLSLVARPMSPHPRLPSFARRTLSRGHGSQDHYEYGASVDFLDVRSCLCTCCAGGAATCC